MTSPPGITMRIACSVSLAVVLAVAVAAGAFDAGAGSVTGPARPNVLLVVTDDQPSGMFTRALMPMVFKHVVDKGMTFKRGYVETPLCCPSRSQILTGLTASHTGVDTNSEPLPATRPTIALALQDAGYRTMLAGKYLNGDSCAPKPGWSRWVCYGPKPSTYSLRDPLLQIDGVWRQYRGPTIERLVDQVGRFIRATPRSTPFFVMLTPTSPHLPADDPRARELPVSPRRPASYDEEVGSTKPRHLRRGPLTAYERGQLLAEQRDMTRSVPPLDASIGRVLAMLGDRADDTLVIFVSDNGYLFGEHRLAGKGSPYEESVRVPFAVRFPRLIRKASTSTALVQNIDIAPTIAELAGIRWQADGRSLVPLLARRLTSLRHELAIENCQASPEPCNPQGTPPAMPGYVGVVTERHKLVRYASGDLELYDLVADPGELRNLAGLPATGALQASLSGRLSRLLAETRQPVVTIAAGPTGLASSRSNSFHFFSPALSTTFQCRLVRDGAVGTWRPCSSGKTFGWLADGQYRFEVRARDAAGALSGVAGRSFAIQTAGPRVAITSGPPDPSPTGNASFEFSTPAPGSRVECRLSRGREIVPWQPCQDGRREFTNLADGSFAFEVRARSGLSVTTPPAAWFFRVSSTGPQATFTEAPSPFTSAATVRFLFVLSIPAQGAVRCSLDDDAPFECSTGAVTLSVAEGTHRFTVTARDAFGREASTSHVFEVDRTRPAFTSVSVAPNPFTPNGDGVADAVKLGGTFSEPSAVFVRVKTPGGFLVFRHAVWRPLNTFATAWGGRDPEGDPLPRGRYPYAIVATDRAGNTKRVTGEIELR